MKTKLLTLLFLAMTGLADINVAMAQPLSIATAEDLNNFAQLVEMGTEVDGVLTADIDLSTSDYPNLMIGTEANPFKGTFDGQWHTITYHYEEVTEKWRGLFALSKEQLSVTSVLREAFTRRIFTLAPSLVVERVTYLWRM